MRQFILLTLFIFGAAQSCIAADAVNTTAIDAGIGRSGQMMDGGVYRVAFPRTDLSVTVRGIKLLPGFALGGYAAFVTASNGVLAVGDLVLLDREVKPVMDSLVKFDFQITALHNHLRYEQPHVMYMHFMASGDAGTIARNLRTALALSRTPLGPASKAQPQPPSFKNAIETGLGRSGKVNGKVLSIGVPRAENVEMNGVIVPPAAGVATAINFQDAGAGNVATTGDFVLIGSEVAPVQQALLAHGIEVTALHSHMIDDSPHLYYMHFWGVGPPATIAAGLKDALSHVNVKP
jgi:uncharacterized protein DUF1259